MSKTPSASSSNSAAAASSNNANTANSTGKSGAGGKQANNNNNSNSKLPAAAAVASNGNSNNNSQLASSNSNSNLSSSNSQNAGNQAASATAGTVNWAAIAARAPKQQNSNAASAAQTPSQTPGANTPVISGTPALSNASGSRNSSTSGQPRHVSGNHSGNAAAPQQQGRKPTPATEPFSMAAGGRAMPIKPSGDAPGIAFGSLDDSTATLSSSPAQRPPMAETRPAQFGSLAASTSAAAPSPSALAASTIHVPAAAVTAKPFVPTGAPKMNLASLDFNKFFQGGDDSERSPEASPALNKAAAAPAVSAPQQQQQQQQPNSMNTAANPALLASTSQHPQHQGAPARRASTYDNAAQAMSPRMMAAGLPHAGTPLGAAGMAHHNNNAARPFSPAGMNKQNSQPQYYQQQGMPVPQSPSTFVPGQLPPGGYAVPSQGGAGYSGGLPGTPGPAGAKINGVQGGPAGAGPRGQGQTTPYMQNRQAPNAAQHIHHGHNRSLGSGSPRLSHATISGPPPTTQAFYPGQPYGSNQQWGAGYPSPYGAYPPYGQYAQPPYYAQQGQQPNQQGRPPMQSQHPSQQSIASSPAPSMRPALSTASGGSGTWVPGSSTTEGPSGTATPSGYTSGLTSPAPSTVSASALPFRPPPHLPSTPSHGQSPSISQTLHASSPSFTPHTPAFGGAAAIASPGASLNAGASSFSFRPAAPLSIAKPVSKALQIKRPPPKEELAKAEKDKADKEKADKEKADKEAADKTAADDKQTSDNKAAADQKKVDDDKKATDEKKALEDKAAAEKAQRAQQEREAAEKAYLEKKVREQEEEAKRIRETKEAEEKANKEREDAEAKRKAEDEAAVATAQAEKKQADDKATDDKAAAEKVEPETPVASGSVTPAEAATPAQTKRPEPLDLSKNADVSEETITAPGSALSHARIIENLEAISYPDTIKSPDAALNQAAQPGKFRYDRDFLLQFMSICKEKPAQLPSLEELGMTDEGPPSAGVGMPRSVSHGGKSRAGPGSVPSTPMSGRGPPGINRAVSSGFAGMGNFSAPNPAALSSAERFAAASSGTLPGRPMARTPSTTGGIPMGGPSGRGGDRRSGRGARRGPPPPTSTMMPGDNAPLEVSENRWTPTVQSRLSKDQPEDSPEVVERKVKALLNKLTIENFDSISKQILDWANKSAKEQDGRILKQVIALIFEKATDEATWSAVYARLCFYLNGALSNEVADQSIKEANGQAPSGGRLFRRYLLTRCQADYERGWAQKESATAAAKGKEADDKAKKDAIEKEAEAAGVDKEQAVKGVDFSEEYYAAEKAKRRGLGLVRFIGELYKLGMLKERIMHECIKKLLADLETPEEEDIESLCRLLLTVGQQMESTSKDAHGHMDVYFMRLQAIVDKKAVSSRLVFMILDVMDARKHGWRTKLAPSGPKSIAEVHQDAARQREEEARRASQGKGLPSRIPMDRGGSRRGQGREAGPDGWQSAPAPRPQKAGDLTTLGKIRSSSGSPALGMLGAKAGQKAAAKEESSMTSNAFALLAGDGEHKEADPTSPPATGPARRPLQLQPRSKPTADDAADTPAEEEEGEVKEDEPEQAATGELDEATKRSIDNSVQEYLSVKMVDEAKQTFEALPVRHRGELAKAFLAKGIDGKVDTVAAVIKLFKGISEAEIIPSEIFRDAFVPTMVDLEDIAGDAPKAFANAASFLKAAALSKEDVEYLQGQMVSNEDDLETIQNRLMEEYEKASP